MGFFFKTEQSKAAFRYHFLLRCMSMLIIFFAVLSAGSKAYAGSFIYELRGTPDQNIWRINPSTGIVTQVVTAYPGGSSATLAQCPDGIVYYVVSAANPAIYKWDPATPATAPTVLPSTLGNIGSSFRLACDQNGGLYYMPNDNVYSVNKTTGVATLVKTITGTGTGGDMAFSPTGVLYILNSSRGLFTFSGALSGGTSSPATSVGTLTGAIGTAATLGLAFNSAGNLYTQTQNPSSMYLVTGTNTTLVGAIGGGTTATGDLASTTTQTATAAKSFSPSTVTVNQASTLTITLSNPNSNTPLFGAAFTDNYPSGLVNVSPLSTTNTCGGTLTATAGGNSIALSGGTIPTGGTCSITVSVRSATAGSYTNTLPAGNLTTSVGYSDAASTSVLTVANGPDIRIAKSHTGNFTAGTTGTYSFTVSNVGNTASSGTITVTDTLPAGLTVNGGAAGAITEGGTNAANWTCNSNAATPQVITCTSTTAIAATTGTSVFNFPVDVGLGTPIGTNSITNNVSVSGGGDTITTNNSASDPTTILSPNLAIAKSHTGNFTVGSTGTYSFTVSNTGTASTSGTITVSDTLPAGLTVNGGAAGAITEGGTNAANWTCNSNAATPQVITCTSTTAISNVAGSNTSVFNFPVNVGLGTAVGTNSITNNVSVSGGNEATANNGNNTALDPTTIVSPDLTIAKSHTGSFIVGGTGAYSFTVTNAGTVSSSGTITITDTLPSGLTVNGGAAGAVTLSGANAANWTCNSNAATPQVITCTSTTAISNTAGSNSSVFGFSVNVGLGTAVGTNSITNSASVSGGSEATANNGNNNTSDPTTVASPDLTLAKSHSGSFTRGSTGTYTLTITNSGTASTNGTITLTDNLPAGLIVNGGAAGAVTLTGTNAANWSCNSNAATPQVITCTSTTAISNTAGSNTSEFNFVVSVLASAANSVTNNASVSGGGEATANNGNNSASDPTSINASAPNVTLVKACTSPANCTTASQLPGTDLIYQITFTNTGGQAASNMAIVDGIPADTDFKLGTAAVNVGSTGLTFVIEYSNDYVAASPGSATWGYVPVSAGGGAPAGYDRNVKAIRWRVTSGNLSNVLPNNTGTVSFVTRIR